MMDFLKNFSFRGLLYNKKFTIPFSILLSFILWVVITVNQKPTMNRTFTDMTVNVNLENTYAAENNMNIIGDISKQKFTVTVRGPSYVVSAMTGSDFNLYASAASVDEPGEYSLEVASAASGAEYEILSISPPTLNVNFDYIETKEFTINALAQGATASEGLITEGGIVSGTESDTVTIKGPRTIINRIETVAALAKVNKTLNQSETFDAEIILYDSEGKVIEQDNLSLSADKVKVTVPISKKKVVPVKVNFSNMPEGFSAKSIKSSIDHSSVTVIGTPETIEKTKSVNLSPIDLRKVSTGSASFDVSAKLPEGVRLLDSIDHFTVKIDMTDYAEKTVTVKTIKYSGLSSGLKTQGGTAIKNVKICGPKSVLLKIKESKIYAQIDLTDKKAGEHTVTASINFDGYKNVWSIGSYTTTVTVK